MTTIFIDPWIPGVNTDAARCPGCHQTLTAVIDGGLNLPSWHHPGPTLVRHTGPRHGQIVVRIDNKGGSPNRCDFTGDDLARLVFIEQRETAERASAA